MSRRRKTAPSPLVEPSRQERRGTFPADMHTGAHLIDPGGHRLVKVGRDLTGDDGVWFESLGANVSMLEQDDKPERTWFLCKACREGGNDWHSWIDTSEIRAALDAVRSDTPRSTSLTTHLSATLWRNSPLRGRSVTEGRSDEVR